jgi:hypothetical protein
MSTKMMSAFTKHTGIPYLRATLGPLVRNVLSQNPALFEVTATLLLCCLLVSHDSFLFSLQVDPKFNPVDGAANMCRLEELCLLFLDTIIKSVSSMPVPFRWMARILHDEVALRFPDSKKTSVGGFLFLRFICPAMLSPEHHGLVDEGVQLAPEKRTIPQNSCVVVLSSETKKRSSSHSCEQSAAESVQRGVVRHQRGLSGAPQQAARREHAPTHRLL